MPSASRWARNTSLKVVCAANSSRIRLNAALVQVSDQTQLWSGSFDGSTGDLLALQRDFAQRIGDALSIRLLNPDGVLGRAHVPTLRQQTTPILPGVSGPIKAPARAFATPRSIINRR